MKGVLEHEFARLRDLMAQGEPVRADVDGIELDVERPLPVLVVHRAGGNQGATRSFVEGHSSYLIAPESTSDAELGALVETIAEGAADRFGAMLLIELWAAEEVIPPGGAACIKIGAGGPGRERPEAIDLLCSALAHVDPTGAGTPLDVDAGGATSPPGRAQLLSEEKRRDLGVLVVGIELPRIHVDARGEPFPQIIRELRPQLFGILHRFTYEFAQMHTTFEVPNYRALGRNMLLPAAWEADEALAGVAVDLDFLLNLTPVNSGSAWRAFSAGGFREKPTFHYRALTHDPDLLKRRLYDIRLEDVADPALASLLRAKRIELDRQLTMLEVRNTDAFVYESIQMYGAPNERVRMIATEILDRVAAPERSDDRAMLSPEEFADQARRELDLYREGRPELQAGVEVRADVSGLITSRGSLLIGTDVSIPPERAAALLHHELGTHVITALNGRSQPLRLLMVGLPGYEETQEGLAVLAEYISGGLDVRRLRLLAARVRAVSAMLDGATFPDTFASLRDLGLSERQSWRASVRVHRSGGFTKDAIYLAGLVRVLSYLEEGGELSWLLAGKLDLEQVPLIEELTWRKILQAPSIMPRWLDVPGAAERLETARKGLGVIDLVAPDRRTA